MVGISNELLQSFFGMVQAITPIVVLIAGWFISKNKDVFNSRKIQKYNLSDYQYTIFLHEAFFSLVNPVIFLMEFVFALWIATKIPSDDYVRLLWSIGIYVALVMITLAAEAERLHRRKIKLKIIADSISKEFSEMMLSVDKEKDNKYQINMFILSAIWIIFIFIPNIAVWNIIGLWDVIVISWIVYCLILEQYMSKRKLGYKTRAKIKSKTIILMDYREDYGCYCNIVLKKEFSFKFQDDKIIIYFPGDISSYTIKQDNLVSIIVGYRVGHFDVKENKYIFNTDAI